MAYQAILNDQLASIHRFVVRMMGDPSEAEDITQEVFLRLWLHASRFNASAAKLTTWLHNIAHNLVVDHFRKYGRMVNTADTGDVPGGEEPDAALFSNLIANDIKEGLMRLPERQRSAIILCHYQGLSNKDAAAILDLSVDALESLMARGRRNLKTTLADHDQRRPS